MPLIQNFRYRPEIDGLRALAVLSVVLFHADFGCSGGFVGVDVFFVISGFLITSLIWKDLENSTFTFAMFWERRARRILPALTVVTFTTLVAGWFLLLPTDYKNLGRAIISQALFVANYHAKVTSNYFATASDEKPLLHIWSLAVEEQFYFIVPFLLVGLFRFVSLRSRYVVLSVLGIGFVWSLVTSMQGLTKSPMGTFYLLPSRAWELLLGSLAAFLPALPNLLQRRLPRELMGLIGLALILVPLWYYDAHTLFPGLAALPPCLGTALVIWTNSGTATGIPTLLGRLLALRPIVFVGAISYSLYLWHWPLLAFSKYETIGPVPILNRFAMVCAAFALASFTWKFVELPFRHRSWGTSTRSMFALAGTGIAAVLACGILCNSMGGIPQRFTSAQQRIAAATLDFSFKNNLTASDVRAGKLVSIGAVNSTSLPAVLVWGDSHAMAAMPAIDQLLKERGLTGKAATHSATPPILNCNNIVGRGMYADSAEFNDAVFTYVQQYKIREVLLIGHWCGYYDKRTKNSDRSDTRLYSDRNAALLKTVQKLVANGVHPTIMLNVPSQPFDVPKVLAQHYRSKAYVDSCSAKLPQKSMPADLDNKLITSLQSAGASIIDPKPLLLDSTGRHYMVQAEGIVLYRDTHHLTVQGCKHILLPLFREKLILESSTARHSPRSSIK